jgi:hypothetical protein
MGDWKSPNFDRIWRLLALFVLCGLVYYFSFDNGRRTAKARLDRYEAERVQMLNRIESLNLQLRLQSEEISQLKAALKQEGGGAPGASAGASSPQPPAGAPTPDELVKGLSEDAGGAAAPGQEDGQGQAPEGAGDGDSGGSPASAGAAAEGAAASSPGGLAIGEAGASDLPPVLNIPESPQAGDSKSQDSKSLERFSLRSGESRLLFSDQVRVSVLEIDSIDKVAQVRVQHMDSDVRQTRTMEAGDSLIVNRGSERFILLLDQLKASSAMFILIAS